MRFATGRLDLHDLVEDLAMATGEEGAAVDHHVHLARSRRHRAARVGEFVRERGAPRGNAVATDATATGLPRSAVDGDLDEIGIDADGRAGRQFGMTREGAPGLAAERPHLARRVHSLERREIGHRDDHLEALPLGRPLDRARRELGDARLESDRIDRRHPELGLWSWRRVGPELCRRPRRLSTSGGRRRAVRRSFRESSISPCRRRARRRGR